MDDIEGDDARYLPNRYGASHGQGCGYLNHQKLHVKDPSYSQPVANEYSQDDNDVDEENEEDEEQLGEEEDDEINQSNGVQLARKDGNDNDDEEDDTDGDGDGDENVDNNGNNDEDNDDMQRSHALKTEEDSVGHSKNRKLKSLTSAYEFAPRVPAAPSAATPSAPKPSSGGRNPLTDWTEHETFVLLDAWGDRFLQRGRKSLRSEEWQGVADKVSEVSKIERTDTQCRNRLDTLKKKYKKEKVKFPGMGGGSSKWLYFTRMDMLMSSPAPPQQAVLSHGLESGKYDSIIPRLNLNHANGLGEMRNSPETTESTSEEGSVVRPQAKKGRKRRRGNDERTCSFRLLADSIHKFSKIYEKIENSRRQQIVELEKMRMDFHKELETEKRQILERVQSEISKLEEGDVENDDSAENGGM